VTKLTRPDDPRGAHLADKYATHALCLAFTLAGALVAFVIYMAAHR